MSVAQLTGATRFSDIAASLEAAAEDIEYGRRDEAARVLSGMQRQVEELDESSTQRRTEAAAELDEVREDVHIVVATKDQLYAMVQQFGSERDKAEQDLARANAGIVSTITTQIVPLQVSLAAKLGELERHRAKIRRRDDVSVGAIFVSIATLGIDRAVAAIDVAIAQSERQIATINTKIAQSERLVDDANQDIAGFQAELDRVAAKRVEIDNLLHVVDSRVAAAAFLEGRCRNLLAYLLEIDLFYGRLRGLIEAVDLRIDDVGDLVAELDAPASILDLDGSASDVVSLREALRRFDEFVDAGPGAMVRQVVESTGLTVNAVRFADGSFQETDLGKWGEFDARRHKVFSFDEVGRDEWSVYLHDPSRSIDLQLDLHRRKVGFRFVGQPYRDLYNIVHSCTLLCDDPCLAAT